MRISADCQSAKQQAASLRYKFIGRACRPRFYKIQCIVIY